MQGLTIDAPPDRPLRVLVIGAHADDIEIGAGGTIMRLVAEHPTLAISWVVLSAEGERADEARASAERMTTGAGSATIQVEAFRERFFPFLPELKDAVRRAWAGRGTGPGHRAEGRRPAPGPPRRRPSWSDRPFAAGWPSSTRSPSSRATSGQPGLFVELSPALVDAKVAHLMSAFPSQRSRGWFREDVFRGLLALRGVEAGAASGYAEAFTARQGPDRCAGLSAVPHDRGTSSPVRTRRPPR